MTLQPLFGGLINFFELKNRKNVTSNEYFYIVDKEIRALKRKVSGFDDANVELYKYYIQSIRYQADSRCILTLFEAIRSISL